MGSEHATAACLQALADGSSVVEPMPLAVDDEPTLEEQIAEIVNFRLNAGPIEVGSELDLTVNLVESQVQLGLVDPDDVIDIVNTVLDQVGTVILVGLFWAVQKLAPFSVKKEIEEDHNTALGIILGAFLLSPPASPG